MSRAVLIAALLALPSYPLAAADTPPRTISVRGRAEVVFPPDHVVVHAAANASADNARAAQTQAHEKATAILSYLRQAGVASDDVDTDRTELRSVRDPIDENCPHQALLSHFEATVAIRFKVRNLAQFDELLSSLTDLGVNRIYSVTSESTQRVAKSKDARIQAVLAGKEKAGYLAKQLGLSLGSPVTVQEVVAKSYFDQSLSNTNSYIVDGVNTFTPSSASFSPTQLSASAEFDIVFEIR